MKKKLECQQGVSSILRRQQRGNRRKQKLCGYEGPTTDWCWSKSNYLLLTYLLTY